MKRVLPDISVLLDLLLNRPPWAADMAVVWDAHCHGKIDAVLAAFSLPTIFYIVRRQTDLATAQQAVQACLATLTIVAVDQQDLLAAVQCPASISRITCRLPARFGLGRTRSSRAIREASPTRRLVS